ncbi:ABC transporter ATP-binding protein/permease [[Clostridium] fimetarium]|uniref:Putative ABC transport system permease protein n=1 Tax=[Clostridium] fimetarium TaxID=99656 RepID=A0A1I0R1R0_9FIRM|nr:ABC transporter ATP-binding protein/permease [[Clostridium] fimetarium]SEW34207.1 putative ABC transport system permease protein [[Clostridium] fimetarium]
MSRLRLTDIRKSYNGGEVVQVLKGISLEFRENEFVSILGPSGCGKTTLLNIVGGLDRYDSGDLLLGDLSTKNFKDSDWDAFRNCSIGFVFQNYNLIAHQTVLQNVEIAMTLSGVSSSQAKQRAKDALKSVGLESQMKKRPNQLSGGQMQRVAIARAIVNNPDIILADEPTGALDSHTSVQVMEILKDIAKTKLVIMVTHNAELADKYSSRVIHLLDGEVQSDSNPIFKDSAIKNPNDTKDANQTVTKKTKLKKTSMSLVTATSLSFKNLLTKRGRTIITSIAGSIGIVGVALVLALSTGLTSYMDKLQSDTLSGYPITISKGVSTLQMGGGNNANSLLGSSSEEGKFTNDNIIYSVDNTQNTLQHTNVLTQEYTDYVSKIQSVLPNAVNAVSFSRGVGINLLAKGEDSVVKYATTAATATEALRGSKTYWQEMPNNEDTILSMYDLIGDGSRLPSSKNEVAIVVDEYNNIDASFFEKLGISATNSDFKLTDFIGKTMLKVIPNDGFYTKDANGIFSAASASEYGDLYKNADGVELTITGILRIKEASSQATGYLSSGLVYTTALTNYVLENTQKSQISIAQASSDKDVILNAAFANAAVKEQKLISLGIDTKPTSISIYPKDFSGKDAIKQYLDDYNADKTQDNQVVYSDLAETIGSTVGTMINTVSYVLIGFAAISLLVSTIMIGIITYVSVLERTKEIGILRAVGARKKDISRLFNAETLIIGFSAGTLGICISYLLIIPINILISNLVDINNIAQLKPLHAVILILGSMTLTLIAGLFPSRMAAKKDPVVALRTE